MFNRNLLCILATVLIVFITPPESVKADGTQDSRGQSEMAERLTVMKDNVRLFSITIYPIVMEDKPVYKIGALVAVMFEQLGIKEIEVDEDGFVPDTNGDIGETTVSFSKFIGNKPMTTDYALFGRYIGTRETGVREVRCIIVDRKGNPVWVDSQAPEDEDFKRINAVNPMLCSYLIVERLRTALGLPEAGKEAPQGKWAEYWRKDSGLPPEKEIAEMKKRCSAEIGNLKDATVLIFPILVNGKASKEQAGNLAGLLKTRKICHAGIAQTEPVFETERSPNEQKRLWGVADQFRTYLKENSIEGDYALYGDYMVRADSEVGSVHFILCDRHGGWVIVDFQNEYHQDFKSINPKSAGDCDRLVARRLEQYVKGE